MKKNKDLLLSLFTNETLNATQKMVILGGVGQCRAKRTERTGEGGYTTYDPGALIND
jgi:hypothetical protein